jgi:hypothetical protein
MQKTVISFAVALGQSWPRSLYWVALSNRTTSPVSN